jgi:hypothetical protein
LAKPQSFSEGDHLTQDLLNLPTPPGRSMHPGEIQRDEENIGPKLMI